MCISPLYQRDGTHLEKRERVTKQHKVQNELLHYLKWNEDIAASVTNEGYHKDIAFKLWVVKRVSRIGLINTFKGMGTPLEEIVPFVQEHTLHNTSLLRFGKA